MADEEIADAVKEQILDLLRNETRTSVQVDAHVKKIEEAKRLAGLS